MIAYSLLSLALQWPCYGRPIISELFNNMVNVLYIQNKDVLLAGMITTTQQGGGLLIKSGVITTATPGKEYKPSWSSSSPFLLRLLLYNSACLCSVLTACAFVYQDATPLRRVVRCHAMLHAHCTTITMIRRSRVILHEWCLWGCCWRY